MRGVIKLNKSSDLDKGKRLWEVLNNHYDGIESKIYFFYQITENPLDYVKMLVQGLHTDLLLPKKDGQDIWPESIRSASMAARILEVITGEDVPRRYQGTKWSNWDEIDESQ